MGHQIAERGATAPAVPTYRLQVWHLSSRRQNHDDNFLLSQFLLSSQDFKGWILRAVRPTVDEQDSCGTYFPLEVDLEFPPPKPRSRFALFKSKPRQSPSDPVSDLAEVFKSVTFATAINEYFETRPGEPHHLVLYPKNSSNELSEEAEFKQTHITILKSLKVEPSTLSTIPAVVPPTDVPAEICRSAKSLANSVSLGADTATLIIASHEDFKNGKPTVDGLEKIRERWPEADSDAAGGGISSEGQLTTKETISRDWTKAEQGLGVFTDVIRNMEDIVQSLSTNSSHAVSSQVLYEALIHARNASIVLSECQKQMVAVEKQLIAYKANNANPNRLYIDAGIICAAILACFLGGAPILLATGAAGGVLGVEIYHQYDISSHKNSIKDLNKTIEALGEALVDADAALAILFCSQVLRKPLDSKHISPRERMALLRELGVDTQQLNGGDYSRELVEAKLMRLCKVYTRFRKQTDDLKKKTGFDTQRTRSGTMIEI
ncbi:hypothetical protein QBC39DRAFT_38848 [Podospora conica]|nr:hypothetical protein QBC39DRAFT_38848 [Schizothecium conicum]